MLFRYVLLGIREIIFLHTEEQNFCSTYRMDDSIINITMLFFATLLLFWFLEHIFSLPWAAKEGRDRVAFMGTWHPANIKPPEDHTLTI